jgi:hypothetical protein
MNVDDSIILVMILTLGIKPAIGGIPAMLSIIIINVPFLRS